MKPEVARICANLIINELNPRLNKHNIKIENSPVEPAEIRLLGCLKYCEVLTTQEIRQMLDEKFNEHK